MVVNVNGWLMDIYIYISGWWYTPLNNDGVRQLG